MTDIWQKPDSSLTICRFTVLLQTCSRSIFYKCHQRKATTTKKRIRNRSGKPHSLNQALVINIVPGWFSILTAMTTELQRSWSRPLSCTVSPRCLCLDSLKSHSLYRQSLCKVTLTSPSGWWIPVQSLRNCSSTIYGTSPTKCWLRSATCLLSSAGSTALD